MKRYLLTAGETYYPQSGAGDWLQSYDSLAEIPDITVIRASSQFSIEGFNSYDWVEVVDTVTFKTIFSADDNSGYETGVVINVLDKVE